MAHSDTVRAVRTIRLEIKYHWPMAEMTPVPMAYPASPVGERVTTASNSS